MKPWPILVCLITAACGAQAAAAPSRPAERQTPWTGGALRDPSGGRAYCALEAAFTNGISVSFAKTSRGEVTLAFAVAGLAAPQGRKFTLRLGLGGDGLQPWSIEAQASVLDDRLIAVPLASITPIAERAHLSPDLTLASGDDTATFRLTALAPALDQLDACASRL